jgi:cobalt/nickel transport protein
MKRKDIFIGLLIAITLAIFSFLASSSPDGLEKVAEDKNFIEKATAILKSPIPDYLFPGITNEKVAASLAGIFGVLVVFILAITIGKLLKEK